MCSRNRPAQGAELVQTVDIFKTRCTFVIEGKEDGTGIAQASLNCSGPGAPVVVIGSSDLDSFSGKFQVLDCARLLWGLVSLQPASQLTELTCRE